MSAQGRNLRKTIYRALSLVHDEEKKAGVVVDCPVTPGCVQHRLSALLLQSPTCSSNGDQSPRPATPLGTFDSMSTGQSTLVSLSSPSSHLLPLPPLFAMLNEQSPGKKEVIKAPITSSLSMPLPTRQNGGSQETGTPHVTIQHRNKLRNKWPPVTKKTTGEEQRRNAVSRDIEQSIQQNRAMVQQRRHLFEQKSSLQGQLQKKWSSSSAQGGSRPGNAILPVKSSASFMSVSSTDTCNGSRDNDGILTSDKVSEVKPSENDTLGASSDGNDGEGSVYDQFSDIVLPSGQRLPPPKGRRRHRRTNYRIRYEGPTLLHLDEVYGVLMDIPEADHRFDAEPRQSGGLRPPRRHHGEDSPRLPRRCRDGTNNGGQDAPPKHPTRGNLSDDDCDDTDEGSLTDDDFYGTMTVPTNGVSDPHRVRGCNRPDVWITPLKLEDGTRKWKVKRVWDVEDVDDEESEIEVHHSDLMNSVRELLGVPEEFGTRSQEWDIEIDEFDPFQSCADMDSPPTIPRKAPFFIKKIWDVDGQLDGSESSMSLDNDEFVNKMKDITETANHENSMDGINYEGLGHSEPDQSPVIRPEKPPTSAELPQMPTPKHEIVFAEEDKEKKGDHDERSDQKKTKEQNRPRSIDGKPVYLGPDGWFAPLTGQDMDQNLSNVSEGKTARGKNGCKSATDCNVATDETEEARRPTQGTQTDADSKPQGVPTWEKLPTWEKQAKRSPKPRQPIKLWWHE